MDKARNILGIMVPYVVSLILIALVTFFGWLIREVFGPLNLDMFYLLIVVMVAVRWGRAPAIMTALLSVLVFNHYFVPPYYSMVGFDIQSAFILIGFLVVGLLVSALASKTRQQAIEANQREAQVTMLYHLSKDLAAANSLGGVLEAIRSNVGKIFKCHVAVFLLSGDKLELSSSDPEFPRSDFEQKVAQKAFKSDHSSEFGRYSLMDAKAQYLPLKTSQGIFGVLGVAFKDDTVIYETSNDYILNALANQSAIAIQRTKLAEVSRQIELMRETEKLQTALLNSISHDLKTPLVSIMGVLDGLLHDFSTIDQQTRQELLATAYEDSDHLNRLVGNLLDMSRLEAKALKIRIEPCELRDVIGVSLQSLKGEIEARKVMVQIPEDIPEVPMDFTLMMRVFINLIDNAVKYSKPDTTIEIVASDLGGRVRIDFKDQGSGIPEEDLEKIFDKFYRAFNPRQITGTGLGLSICKGITELHGGEIFARNNADRGATISVILPESQTKGTNDGQ